jgi:E3 ubiquitin-protein ligase BRE1
MKEIAPVVQEVDANMKDDVEETKTPSIVNSDKAGKSSDSEAQIGGLKKINQALFEVITDLSKQEFIQDQEFTKSRAFNRLVRNGHQMLQAHEELLNANQDLAKKFEDLERQRDDVIDRLSRDNNDKISQFQSLMQTNEIQMKISQIEKDNLQKEVNRLKSGDAETLKASNDDLTKTLDLTEKDNKKVKDDLQRVIKEKSAISDRLNTLRIEYDNHLNSSGDITNKQKDVELVEVQSKQIKDLIEEMNNTKAQIDELYSEMEAIFQANQDLENKNKVCNSKIDDCNKRVEKLTEETFKWSLQNDKCKEEVKQIEIQMKVKDEKIKSFESKIKLLIDTVEVEKQLCATYKDRELVKTEIIKELEKELDEIKRKMGDQKQHLEEADAIINKTHDDVSNRLFTMSVNFFKTGKIKDARAFGLTSESIGDMDETEILMLELQKYKSMVKCPTCKTNDRCVRLNCPHTFCESCVDENISNRNRKCPNCNLKFSGGDCVKFILN